MACRRLWQGRSSRTGDAGRLRTALPVSLAKRSIDRVVARGGGSHNFLRILPNSGALLSVEGEAQPRADRLPFLRSKTTYRGKSRRAACRSHVSVSNSIEMHALRLPPGKEGRTVTSCQDGSRPQDWYARELAFDDVA